MGDHFDAMAYDPATNQLLAGATFEVFAEGDLGRTTPLAVFEATSGASLPVLMSNNVGALPQFSVEGDPQVVILKSGDFETRLKSAEGSRGPAGKSAYQYAVEGGFLGDEEEFAELQARLGKIPKFTEIDAGQLKYTYYDGTTELVGQVVGADGVGIASFAVVAGELLVTLTDGTTDNAGALPAGPTVSTAGATAGQVYTFDGVEPGWDDAGAGITGAPSTWPETFPPSAHNTETSTLRVSGAALAAAVLSLLAAGDAAAARAAIGAGTGTSNLVIGTGPGNAAAGNHGHAASAITFTPSGAVTATTVQAAILQAAGLGGGASSAFVFHTGTDWPADADVPTTTHPKLWISTNASGASSPEGRAAFKTGDNWLPHPAYFGG